MKRSDIIIDALGTLDDKTLEVPEAPEKERIQHILPQVLAACAVLLTGLLRQNEIDWTKE